jgi:chromosome condensin MukBEF MukE localization factor
LKFGLLTILLIPLNIIRLSIACFLYLTRVGQGVIFEEVEIVRDLMALAKTRNGLKVLTTILDGVYTTGRKVTEAFKQSMGIVFDDYLPKWN